MFIQTPVILLHIPSLVRRPRGSERHCRSFEPSFRNYSHSCRRLPHSRSCWFPPVIWNPCSGLANFSADIQKSSSGSLRSPDSLITSWPSLLLAARLARHRLCTTLVIAWFCEGLQPTLDFLLIFISQTPLLLAGAGCRREELSCSPAHLKRQPPSRSYVHDFILIPSHYRVCPVPTSHASLVQSPESPEKEGKKEHSKLLSSPPLLVFSSVPRTTAQRATCTTLHLIRRVGRIDTTYGIQPGRSIPRSVR